MKSALLVFQPQEKFDRRDSAMAAAGKAYGEALRAAGVVVTAAGLQPPQSGTMVSVRAVPPKNWTLFRGSERKELWIRKRFQRDRQGEKFIPKSSGARWWII